MPEGTPGIKEMWALMGELAGVSGAALGANPHRSLVG
jgi:hypothetical protein